MNFIVALDSTAALERDTALQLLQYAVLEWQKRRTMHIFNRPEFAFYIDQLIPMLGTPLASLYSELRIGDELQNMGVILQRVAKRMDGARPRLRERIFAYTTATLRNDRASKLRDNVFWLLTGLSQPQVVPLLSLVRSHCPGEQEGALWAEVDVARARLLKGDHFQDLSLSLTRELAQHFHRALVEGSKKPVKHPRSRAAPSADAPPSGHPGTKHGYTPNPTLREVRNASWRRFVFSDAHPTLRKCFFSERQPKRPLPYTGTFCRQPPCSAENECALVAVPSAVLGFLTLACQGAR